MNNKTQLGHSETICYSTCDVIVCPVVHFDVVPLVDHAAVCAGCSNRHIHIVLVAECVNRQRLGCHRLMEHEICGKAHSEMKIQPTNQSHVALSWTTLLRYLSLKSSDYILCCVLKVYFTENLNAPQAKPASLAFSHPLRCIRSASWLCHWVACPSCPLVRHTRHPTLWHWCSSATSSATWHGSHTQRSCLAGPCKREGLSVFSEEQSRLTRRHLQRKERDRKKIPLDVMCQQGHYLDYCTDLQFDEWVQVNEEVPG